MTRRAADGTTIDAPRAIDAQTDCASMVRGE
jgi:hypothetical protein